MRGAGAASIIFMPHLTLSIQIKPFPAVTRESGAQHGCGVLNAGLRLLLNVAGFEAGLLGEHFQRNRSQCGPIMIGKQDVGPAGSPENAMRTFLALDTPPRPKQRGESFPRFDRGPGPGWNLMRQ